MERQDQRGVERRAAKYERQHYIGVNPNLREKEQQEQLEAKEAQFVALILKAFKAEPTTGLRVFHGKKAGRTVGRAGQPARHAAVRGRDHFGVPAEAPYAGRPVGLRVRDGPVSQRTRRGAVEGHRHRAQVHSRRSVRQAGGGERPGRVSRRGGHRSQAGRQRQDRGRRVDYFPVYYTQDSTKAAIEALKNKASKIVVDRGQIVKITKDAKGIVSKEKLIKHWNDWIDYWSVDFDFENKREIIRVRKEVATTAQGRLPGLTPDQKNLEEWEEVWTGDFIFENEWQSFRTKKERKLELTSAFKEVDKKRVKIAVKVVDIFGNDTMPIIDVSLKR